MKRKMFVTTIMIIVLIITVFMINNSEKYSDMTFEKAIECIKDTKGIIVYDRNIDLQTGKLIVTQVGTLNKEEVNEIINILTDGSEWTGNITLQFVPGKELHLYDKDNSKIGKIILNEVSDLVIGKKSFFLYNFDNYAIDKVLQNLLT